MGSGMDWGDLASNAALLCRMLDELDYGLLLVDANARVHLANREAKRECATGLSVTLCDDQVRPCDRSKCEPFRRALTASQAGRRTMLTLGPVDAPLSLAVVPLDVPAALCEARVTLLVLGKRKTCEPLSVAFFVREHRLTAAEGQVLHALCDGMCPAAIGKQAGVAVSTVRTHVASIRLKTGTRRISELVSRVASLPPIIAVA